MLPSVEFLLQLQSVITIFIQYFTDIVEEVVVPEHHLALTIDGYHVRGRFSTGAVAADDVAFILATEGSRWGTVQAGKLHGATTVDIAWKATVTVDCLLGAGEDQEHEKGGQKECWDVGDHG